MRTVPIWVDKVHTRDNSEQQIYDLCFSADGTQLIAAAGNKVLVYEALTGTLLHSLKGHKDIVYCVAFAKDGKRFASGGADKNVIIWTSGMEAILKYSHNDTIQCVSYNPVSPILASCSSNDFGLWSPEQKNVQKYRVSSRVCSCSWNDDGTLLALGLANGTISIRNRSGDEKSKIERPGGNQSPVWALCWNINRSDQAEMLCVTDWGNRTLSFHLTNGKQIRSEKPLGFNACRIVPYRHAGGDYLLVCGSSRQCQLFSSEGYALGSIAECSKWVWATATKQNSTVVAVGSEDGTVGCHQLIFSTVHGLYKERYAFREHLTDVVVHHLLTEEKVRICCRDLIKKIAIYKNRLAVQLQEKLMIYEQQEGEQLHYVIKERISQNFECSLMVICTNHIILCHEKKLQSVNFQGVKEREWTLDSPVRYIKIVGGPANKEGLLLGLKNGQVSKIFLDNPFPVELLKISVPIRCLDLSSSRQKVAIVDDNNTCSVYQLSNNELICQEPHANSVAWNIHCEDMLCFSGQNWLNIKASNFPCHQQKFQGYVVGFYGAKIFCLQGYSMTTLQVPLSAPMYQYLDRKLYREAYEVACMGVTEADWSQLAHESVNALELEIATQAFQRIQDYKYLELMESIANQKRLGGPQANINHNVFIGDILAWQGKFNEAARLYRKCGRSDKAVALFTDLRLFDQAQEYLSGDSTVERMTILKKRADWAQDIHDPRAAAEMYLNAGEILKAVEIIAANGWTSMLVDASRKLDVTDQASTLRIISDHLRRLGSVQLACDILRRLGDTTALAAALVECGAWTEALTLAKQIPDLSRNVYLPYARWLAEQEQFIEAQQAYYEAGCLEEAERVLNTLAMNAVALNKYEDASHFFWLFAKHRLQLAAKTDLSNEALKHITQFHALERKSSAYYAYQAIHRFTNEPFTSSLPEALFNMARYLLHETLHGPLTGISQFAVVYSLMKHAKTLGAYKTAKHAVTLLQNLKIPVQFQESVDLAVLSIRAQPYQDAEDLLPLCYRCSMSNPLYNPRGNCCIHCGENFIFSFISFEILPLVEFYIEEDISAAEALQLIKTEPPKATNDLRNGEDYQLYENDKQSTDPFSSYFYSHQLRDQTSKIILNRDALLRLKPTEVIVCRWPSPLPSQYYRNFLPDVALKHCKHCNKIFHADDYELHYLQKNQCPFCRSSRSSPTF
uniref:Intraflagellar transport protein 122 homolog n=1 Tax=Daphnia galeata TaxID=27404 RepID=A0A8J2WEW2_9CRUS|nr:unnamed protein product [Daphnia galeata]